MHAINKHRKENRCFGSPARIGLIALAAAIPAMGHSATYYWSDGHYLKSRVNTGLPSTINSDDIVIASAKTNSNLNAWDEGYGLKVFNAVKVINNGTFSWSESLWDMMLVHGSEFTNNSLMDFQYDVRVRYIGVGGGHNIIVNGANGTLRKSSGAGVLDFQWQNKAYDEVFFTNLGTLDCQSGTIRYGWTNQAFGDGTRFTGVGAHEIYNVGDFNHTTHLGGNITISPETSLGFSASNEWGATFGDGAMINGAFTLKQGTINGTWTLGPNSEMKVIATPGNQGLSNATVDNYGTISLNDHLGMYGSTLTNYGVIALHDDVKLDRFNLGNGSSLVNYGTIVKDGGTGEGFVADDWGMSLSNYGTIHVKMGTLSVDTNQFTENRGTIRVDAGTHFKMLMDCRNYGKIAGYGTYEITQSGNRLYNYGVIDPGGSIGTLTLDTDLTQGSAGSLAIEIAGIADGEYDVLNVLGTAQLGGTLDLYRFGDYNPLLGDSIRFLVANSVTGSMNVVLHGFTPGTKFDLNLRGGYADLTVAAVPEPCSLAALALGGIGIFLRRRNKSRQL